MVSPLHHQTLDKWAPNGLSVSPSTGRKSCVQPTKQHTPPSLCASALKSHFLGCSSSQIHTCTRQEEIPDASCICSHLLTNPSHTPGLAVGPQQLWELLCIPPHRELLCIPPHRVLPTDRVRLSWHQLLGAGLALGPWGRADPRHSPEVWGVGRTLMGLGDTSTAGPGAGGQQAAELWP